MFCPKGPFDNLTGLVGIGMPLIAALVVEKELQDARERRERSKCSDDKNDPKKQRRAAPGESLVNQSFATYEELNQQKAFNSYFLIT